MGHQHAWAGKILGGNCSTLQMFIEEVDGPGPSLFSSLFVVPLGVSEVHERVISAFVGEEGMSLTQAC